MNALYYLSLTQMAKLAGIEGGTALASTYAAEAVKLRSVINAKLWNPSVGAYQLSPSQPDVFPQDAQAMAILAGVASQAQARRALRYLRRNTWSRFGSLTVSPTDTSSPIPSFYGPLPSAFEVTARYEASTGPADDAVAQQLMQRFWGYMLTAALGPQSTLWETVNQQGQPGNGQFTSLAHGWASEPTVDLTTQVLGVQPARAGFASYLVHPHPGTLRWAEGKVPTPHGPIFVSWRQSAGGFAIRVDAPRGTSGQVDVPTFGRSVEVGVDGRLAWTGTTSTTYGARSTGDDIVLNEVPAGTHTITAAVAGPTQQPIGHVGG